MNWKKLFCAAILASGTAFAQGFELGAVGGFSYAPSLGVTASLGVTESSATASAGIGHGGVVGAYGGEDMYRYIGGELRYLYGFGNLQASSDNASVTFARNTQTITFNVLGYLRPTGSAVRPFLALGGGVVVVSGTGAESAAQPLGNFVALTHTRETLGVGDVGVGLKISISKRVRLRLEAHDYMSPFPDKVIAPAPGASIGGFMNNIVGVASIGWTLRGTD
ncbi:MAG TPA: hypothetical protein VIY49_22125 [Bryobacteraceae bacterium]